MSNTRLGGSSLKTPHNWAKWMYAEVGEGADFSPESISTQLNRCWRLGYGKISLIEGWWTYEVEFTRKGVSPVRD